MCLQSQTRRRRWGRRGTAAPWPQTSPDSGRRHPRLSRRWRTRSARCPCLKEKDSLGGWSGGWRVPTADPPPGTWPHTAGAASAPNTKRALAERRSPGQAGTQAETWTDAVLRGPPEDLANHDPHVLPRGGRQRLAPPSVSPTHGPRVLAFQGTGWGSPAPTRLSARVLGSTQAPSQRLAPERQFGRSAS